MMFRGAPEGAIFDRRSVDPWGGRGGRWVCWVTAAAATAAVVVVVGRAGLTPETLSLLRSRQVHVAGITCRPTK